MPFGLKVSQRYYGASERISNEFTLAGRGISISCRKLIGIPSPPSLVTNYIEPKVDYVLHAMNNHANRMHEIIFGKKKSAREEEKFSNDFLIYFYYFFLLLKKCTRYLSIYNSIQNVLSNL